MLNVYKILQNTKVEGPGNRFCIWFQGCSRHCLGCFAKQTWEFGNGIDYSADELFCLIMREKDIEGVTFLGGEPFEQVDDLCILAKKIKAQNLSVVCFTGCTLEELQAKNSPKINELLGYIDLLIDGEFEQENFDLSRPWVGSANQRYIFLSDYYCLEDIKKYKNKIEMRISRDAKLEINGMGDFSRIREKFCLQLGKNNVK